MPHSDSQSLSEFLSILAEQGYRRLIVTGSGAGDEGAIDDIFVSESPTEDDELDPDDLDGIRDSYESIESLLSLVSHTQWQDNQGGNFRIVLSCPEDSGAWQISGTDSYVQLNESVPKTRPLSEGLLDPENADPSLTAYLQAHFLAVRAGTAKPFTKPLKFLVSIEGDGSDISLAEDGLELTDTEKDLWVSFIVEMVVDRLDLDANIHVEEHEPSNLEILPEASPDGGFRLNILHSPTVTRYVDEPSENLIEVQDTLDDLLDQTPALLPSM